MMMSCDEFTIGFDVRALRSKDDLWHSDYLLNKDVSAVVSVDPFVFPIPSNEKIRRAHTAAAPKENPLGLLSEPLDVQDFSSWEIAVTIQEDVFTRLTNQFGVPLITSALSKASLLLKQNWIFIGYDVIDIRGLISGLLNCGPHSTECQEQFLPHINSFGLFSSRAYAKLFCELRGHQIPSHSPFYPTSIWKHMPPI